MTKQTNFLPLGSIIVLKQTTQKLIIIARGMLVEENYYDYGAFLYPQGLIEDSLVYFNEDQISKVMFHGFTDDDDTLFISYIDEAIEQRNSEIEAKKDDDDGVKQATALEAVEEEDLFASIRDLAD